MRKFTTIIVAVVLCLATLAVCASAAATKCSEGEHDWSAWTLVKVLEDGTKLYERNCACGKVDSTSEAPAHKCTIAYMPATEACHVPGCAEYWYCTDATCQAVYADEAGTQITNRKNLETPAVVELQHIEAVAACHANGYLEHWYCSKCDAYFADAAATQLTNIKNLTVEGDLSKLEYHAAVAATATENGMQEYWACEGCKCFFTDAEGKYNIAYLSLTIPATGEPTSPDTGDNAIFFIVALVAVATLGVAAVSFKKREN